MERSADDVKLPDPALWSEDGEGPMMTLLPELLDGMAELLRKPGEDLERAARERSDPEDVNVGGWDLDMRKSSVEEASYVPPPSTRGLGMMDADDKVREAG
jgi:hypothetical protein